MKDRVSRGRPWPLGITLSEEGANVAVWAPDAERVWLCLFEGEQEERIPLPHHAGGVWHAHVRGIEAGARYGLRADGPFAPEQGLCFDEQKLLIDPYARALDAPARWDRLMSDSRVQEPDDGSVTLARDRPDSAPAVPKGIVLGEPAGPDPAANRPRHDVADLVIYEAHAKGLTATHPEVPEELRGTYSGIAHPAIIDHLTSLGVTAVELLPVQAFLDDEHIVERGLSNYWGYQPIAWHAPEPRYAIRDADAEMRGLVHTLHEAGIEVFIDVVCNHTGEGGDGGPTLSLRGLDASGYYRLHDGTHIDDTGTGNTVATERPTVLRLVLDSLRHWATRYGIDGFRFDLATAVGRGPDGFDPRVAFFQAAGQDPVLADVKLIAEPWDLGPDGYQLGGYPHPWSEWNDGFRDDVRRAWRGDQDAVRALGERLLGSAAAFDHSGRAPTASVNFITAHDGFTLADVVSYTARHNEANLEDGRDGHSENHSDNLGVEGPTDDPGVLAARSRRVRAMLATLLVSQGVPMLLAGDEIGNTQGGNNNAYAQDNEIGWIDWSSPDRKLLDVVAGLIEVRRRLPILRQRTFLHGGARAGGDPDVLWLSADGEPATEEHWEDPELRTIIAVLRGAAGDPTGEALPGAVAVVLNLGDAVEVSLPEDLQWRLEIDSGGEAEPGRSGGQRIGAQSVVVFSSPGP
ncbi:glycogen debranching protein GlgX [Nesterenkonia sp. HG001]|uniref:glycogen debranching protein GlgX n=1 Tax=Nesterenkonia sp. HG001 TaxID=2983207 RepID=UPI002AC74E0E|nr:glycogen debranching protein GlgX [Nesterenkonia sp. HG001]MDZ5076482.1 glycogen debranching protein GlgX [Nesterenkonia sp. HG001]